MEPGRGLENLNAALLVVGKIFAQRIDAGPAHVIAIAIRKRAEQEIDRLFAGGGCAPIPVTREPIDRAGEIADARVQLIDCRGSGSGG